jgi:predicted nucleic acid-binding protein
MGEMSMRAYLDSCIVIYLIEGERSLSESIMQRLLPTTGVPPSVVISDLTRLECRVKPPRDADTALLAMYDAFFATPEYRQLALDTAVVDLATDLRAHLAVPTPDALHLAAAMVSGCEELWTNDARLSRAGVQTGSLRAVDPTT